MRVTKWEEKLAKMISYQWLMPVVRSDGGRIFCDFNEFPGSFKPKVVSSSKDTFEEVRFEIIPKRTSCVSSF